MPVSALVVRVWDDKLVELDQEVQVEGLDQLSVLDSLGRFRYKELRHLLTVVGRAVYGLNTNFGADIGESVLFSGLTTLEKNQFSKRETSQMALIPVEKIIAPNLLLLSHSPSEHRYFPLGSMAHYYSVWPLPTIPPLPIHLECPATISLGAPLWQTRFESSCLDVPYDAGFLFSVGVLFPYVGKPRFHGVTIELYAGKELAAYYLLGWKDNIESIFTVPTRPGEKQSYSRPFFDDPYSNLYIAYHNNTILLGKGQVVGDIVKFKSRLYAHITHISIRSPTTLILKNAQLRDLSPAIERAVAFAKALPSLADKATFTEELTEGAICELTKEPRVASVVYTCGSEDTTFLKSVNEYASCKYTAVVATPALCPASAADTDDIENIDCIAT
jgi:hypothetical protein